MVNLPNWNASKCTRAISLSLGVPSSIGYVWKSMIAKWKEKWWILEYFTPFGLQSSNAKFSPLWLDFEFLILLKLRPVPSPMYDLAGLFGFLNSCSHSAELMANSLECSNKEMKISW